MSYPQNPKVLGVGTSLSVSVTGVRTVWCGERTINLIRGANRNMEAIALHDFHATAEDELSFKKGSILKVMYMYTRNCVNT